MSFYGKNADLLLDGLSPAGYFSESGLDISVDTAAAAMFGAAWKKNYTGQAAAVVSLVGLYDPAFVALPATLQAAGSGSILTVGPLGLDTMGILARLMQVLSTSYKESDPVGGLVAFNWGILANGRVGWGYVLSPLAAVEADGVTPTHTGPLGGTTGGAIAHLHVTSVSAGDTIVVTIQHSTDDITWDTLAVFDLMSAPGAQRLVITGTVRQYTRLSLDVAGVSVSIIAGVYLART